MNEEMKELVELIAELRKEMNGLEEDDVDYIALQFELNHWNSCLKDLREARGR